MMEGGVEDRHLGNILAEELARRHDALEVVRIMKRGQIDALFNALQDLAVDERRLGKQLAAVHYAMAHGLNVSRAFDLSDA